MKKKKSILGSLWQFLLIYLYTLKILWRIYWHYGDFTLAQRRLDLKQRARHLLLMMGVRLELEGEAFLDERCLRAVNHVSWLDILVLYACSPCRFIAKSEVKHYPLIGRLASNAGTLFLNRGSSKDAIRMSESIAEAIKAGDCVAFFPEATTSEGDGVLPLHASLFEGAILAQSPVQAVVLRYHTSESLRALKSAAYVRSSLLVGLWKILRQGDVQALVKPLLQIDIDQQSTRQGVCALVQKTMEEQLNQLNYGTELSKLESLNGLFLQDAKTWIRDGQCYLTLLKRKPTDWRMAAQVRQNFYLLKKSASLIDLKPWEAFAESSEKIMNQQIKSKQRVADEILEFCEAALQLFSDWLASPDHYVERPPNLSQLVSRARSYLKE